MANTFPCEAIKTVEMFKSVSIFVVLWRGVVCHVFVR